VFCRPEQAIDVCTAIVKVRATTATAPDRKLATDEVPDRQLGLERFRAKVEEYWRPWPLPSGRCHSLDDHLGWHEQGDGRFYMG
jgi:sulfite reductase (ferredoxin)